MRGINVSQARATRLAKSKKVFLCPETGFWVKTNKLFSYDKDLYQTGDKLETIPSTAYQWIPGYNPEEMEEEG